MRCCANKIVTAALVSIVMLSLATVTVRAQTAPWRVNEFVRICANNVPNLERVEVLAKDENWAVEPAENLKKLFGKAPKGQKSWIVSSQPMPFRIRLYFLPVPESLKNEAPFKDAKSISSCTAMFDADAPTEEMFDAIGKVLKVEPSYTKKKSGTNILRTEWPGKTEKFDVSVMFNEYIGRKRRGDYIEVVVLLK